MSSTGEDMEQLELSHTVGRNSMVQLFVNSLAVPYNIKQTTYNQQSDS